MAMLALDELLETLVISPSGGGFVAPSLPLPHGGIFGGQLLAQAIVGAAASAEDKTVKSVQALFPAEGDGTVPLEFAVEQLPTGRTFAARSVTATQRDRTYFSALVSLHADEDGFEHHDDLPAVDGPAAASAADLVMIPWECRVVDGVDLTDPAVGPAALRWWTRIGDRSLGDELALHQALLAYATDLTLIGTALRPHPQVSEADAHVRVATAVTSHAVWFHRPFRIDDWLLIDQRSPVAAGGRAFGTGNVFDTDGALVASFAQESMIRPPKEAQR